MQTEQRKRFHELREYERSRGQWDRRDIDPNEWDEEDWDEEHADRRAEAEKQRRARRNYTPWEIAVECSYVLDRLVGAVVSQDDRVVRTQLMQEALALEMVRAKWRQQEEIRRQEEETRVVRISCSLRVPSRAGQRIRLLLNWRAGHLKDSPEYNAPKSWLDPRWCRSEAEWEIWHHRVARRAAVDTVEEQMKLHRLVHYAPAGYRNPLSFNYGESALVARAAGRLRDEYPGTWPLVRIPWNGNVVVLHMPTFRGSHPRGGWGI